LQNVSKHYDGNAALEPTTLDVPAERCLALIGPSGCGKSTLLRLIVGLIEPDEGELAVAGTPGAPATILAPPPPSGYLLHDGGLLPHLTAAGNATLMAETLRWDRARLRTRLEELAELVRLPAVMLERYPAQLSGGQRQRVGLMRALMLDPEVLLMDEP